jgi:hypothetical protein
MGRGADSAGGRGRTAERSWSRREGVCGNRGKIKFLTDVLWGQWKF